MYRTEKRGTLKWSFWCLKIPHCPTWLSTVASLWFCPPASVDCVSLFEQASSCYGVFFFLPFVSPTPSFILWFFDRNTFVFSSGASEQIVCVVFCDSYYCEMPQKQSYCLVFLFSFFFATVAQNKQKSNINFWMCFCCLEHTKKCWVIVIQRWMNIGLTTCWINLTQQAGLFLHSILLFVPNTLLFLSNIFHFIVFLAILLD